MLSPLALCRIQSLSRPEQLFGAFASAPTVERTPAWAPRSSVPQPTTLEYPAEIYPPGFPVRIQEKCISRWLNSRPRRTRLNGSEGVCRAFGTTSVVRHKPLAALRRSQREHSTLHSPLTVRGYINCDFLESERF